MQLNHTCGENTETGRSSYIKFIGRHIQHIIKLVIKQIVYILCLFYREKGDFLGHLEFKEKRELVFQDPR